MCFEAIENNSLESKVYGTHFYITGRLSVPNYISVSCSRRLVDKERNPFH